MDNSHPEYEDLLRRLEGILLPWAEQYSDQNLNSGSAPHADLTVNDNGRERADFAALERVDAICQDLRSRTQEWLKNRNLHSAQSHQHIVPEECPPEPLIPDRTSTVPSKRPCVEPRPRQTRPKRKKRAPVTARVEVDEGAFEELGILDLDASIECPYMLHSCLIGGHACNSPPVFTGRTAKRDLR
ncbi:hypothetical protein BJ508DRAFT_49561 [Ascobolus immersus RN42]|uniref:Uncharacterized protein n=1 Tax=Ascobolus immersus RN42 TaxID=1160509 RepID=A0A3N4HNV5_ASCIM|nr:hypothetical protein BJ508DRAFT_49561 [Ascobolus immersus RN42]